MKIFDSIKKNIKQTTCNTNTAANTKGWSAKRPERKPSGRKTIKTYNLIIVDESGSMCSIYRQALTGMNETLQTIREAQREHHEQQQFVTLVTFDSGHYNAIYDAVPVTKTGNLTDKDYNPCGGTPLFDAMGRAVTELARKVDEGDSVLVTIITDGYENCSCEYSGQDIKRLVELLKEKGWLFTYIGANQDSISFGATISITNTLNFEATESGTKQMFAKEKQSRKKYYNRRMENPEANLACESDYFAD